jgi:hypothetical protein
MTLRTYTLIMSLTTIFAWLLWLSILSLVDPEVTTWIGFSLFYSSLFLALVGTSALVGFFVRFIAMKKELAFRLVKEAFRQSFLFSSLVIISLLLLSEGLFSWLNVILLVLGLSILEFFLLSLSNNRKA